MHHLTFDSASSTGQTAGTFINSTAFGVFVRDFEMLGGFGPIRLNTTIAYIEGGSFRNTSPGGVTIQIDGGNDQYLQHLVSDNDPARQPAYGILITDSDATWMDSVDFIQSGTGLGMVPGPGKHITWPFVSNSAFDTNASYGMLFDVSAPGSAIMGGMFTGSWASTNAGGGVLTTGLNGVIDGLGFVGFRVFNNGLSGVILAKPTVHNFTCDACMVAGNGTFSPGTYSGFDIGAGVSEFSIRNSRSGGAYGFSPTMQGRGILINPGASDHYQIVNNDVRGNANAAILDAGTGVDKIITGNLGMPRSLTITAPGSALTHTVAQAGTIFLSGSAGVTGIAIVRGSVTVPMPATVTTIPVSAGDVVSVTYTSAPVVQFLAS